MDRLLSFNNTHYRYSAEKGTLIAVNLPELQMTRWKVAPQLTVGTMFEPIIMFKIAEIMTRVPVSQIVHTWAEQHRRQHELGLDSAWNSFPTQAAKLSSLRIHFPLAIWVDSTMIGYPLGPNLDIWHIGPQPSPCLELWGVKVHKMVNFGNSFLWNTLMDFRELYSNCTTLPFTCTALQYHSLMMFKAAGLLFPNFSHRLRKMYFSEATFRLKHYRLHQIISSQFLHSLPN